MQKASLPVCGLGQRTRLVFALTSGLALNEFFTPHTMLESQPASGYLQTQTSCVLYRRCTYVLLSFFSAFILFAHRLPGCQPENLARRIHGLQELLGCRGHGLQEQALTRPPHIMNSSPKQPPPFTWLRGFAHLMRQVQTRAKTKTADLPRLPAQQPIQSEKAESSVKETLRP